MELPFTNDDGRQRRALFTTTCDQQTPLSACKDLTTTAFVINDCRCWDHTLLCLSGIEHKDQIFSCRSFMDHFQTIYRPLSCFLSLPPQFQKTAIMPVSLCKSSPTPTAYVFHIN
jgi:hypothetical protein